MLINSELLEIIRLKNPIVSVIGKYADITENHRKFSCKCPFCDSKINTLRIFPEQVTYTCFSCGNSGDVIGFVSKTEKLKFADTVRRMAENSCIMTLEEREKVGYMRFWDRFMLLCEFYHVSADRVTKYFGENLTREYILSLKYSKNEPETEWLKEKLCKKFEVCEDFWTADSDKIMDCLVSRKAKL